MPSVFVSRRRQKSCLSQAGPIFRTLVRRPHTLFIRSRRRVDYRCTRVRPRTMWSWEGSPTLTICSNSFKKKPSTSRTASQLCQKNVCTAIPTMHSSKNAASNSKAFWECSLPWTGESKTTWSSMHSLPSKKVNMQNSWRTHIPI